MSSLEQDFKRVGGLAYSEGGHLYQLSYAVEAAKNSEGVVFIKSGNVWYLFKNKVNSQEQDTLSENLHFSNGVCFYFLGHKIGIPYLKSYLNSALLDRAYYLQSAFQKGTIPSGHGLYIKSKLMHYNSIMAMESRIPSGVSVVSMVCETTEEPTLMSLVYPNNKVVQKDVLWEGNLSEDQVLELFKVLKQDRTVTLQESFFHLNEDLINKLKDSLRDWEIHLIDPKSKKETKL